MSNFDFLRQNEFFWSRLGFCYDPPRADKDGNQIIFSRNYKKYRKFHKDFEKAGINYHTTILHSGWVGDDKYDYRLTDEVLDKVLGGNPDILYMPRVKLNAPVDWCKNHPEDVFVYEGFEFFPEEIAQKCGTEKQDWFGYDSANGYSINGGDGSFKDDRPNLGSEIGLQSFSSLNWHNDASKALAKLIEHINQTPYAKQIIGYHIAYGMCGETALWGGWRRRNEKRRGDFGINNRKRFIEFGLEKYGSEEELCARWRVEKVSDIQIPSLEIRDMPKNELRELFYDEEHNLICRDYNEFISKANAEACEKFCRTVKESAGENIAAGIFYGYMYMPKSAYSGHLGIDEVLKSPYIDFVASPKAYFRSLPGDPGGEQGPSYSINMKKVWLDEIDNHTHLDLRRDEAQDLFETRTLLLREAVKNISTSQGFWWMDLGEGGYDSPEVMDIIVDLKKTAKKASEKTHKSIAEILLVVDEGSIKSMSASLGLSGGFMYNMQSELKLCGAPVDTLRMSDLYNTDLSQYKMIVFANTFAIDEKMYELLKRNATGKTYVWNYAAGILNSGFNIENVTKLTGFKIKEFENEYQNEEFGYKLTPYKFREVPELYIDFPLVEIQEDDSVNVIDRYPNKKVMNAEIDYFGGKSIMCAFPSFTAEQFRKVAKEAGCKMYAPENCTVYADNRIIGIFPKYDVDFTLDLGEYSVGGKNKIDLKINSKGAEYFIFD